MSTDEGRVAHLERMADSMDAVGVRPDAILDAIVMTTGERGCVGTGAREKVEEGFEPLRVVRQVGWKLPKEWAEFFAKMQYSGSEEICERCIDILQPFEV